MKARESGMPDEAYWSSFFDAGPVLEMLLGTNHPRGDVVEFGCGYGTFTLPCARKTLGIVTALDIEPEMVAHVQQRSDECGLTNVHTEVRDFIAQGTGLDAASQAHAMVYNILHLERPVMLLEEARRTLGPTGSLSVIHWRSDVQTPRGPPITIRPTPEQCAEWMKTAGFGAIEHVALGDSAPYHFGVIGKL